MPKRKILGYATYVVVPEPSDKILKLLISRVQHSKIAILYCETILG